MEGLVSADKSTVLPLKDISVQVKVKGYLVGVSSTLNYSNDTTNPLEVTFRFPLEESFAVVGLEAIIDGRKVKAAVHEKEKARDMYDDAITSGLTAAYGEEKAGDIFSLSLGNLPSGSGAEIKLRMVGELPIEADGRVRFTLPSVLKPRYTPEGSSDLLAATQNPSVKQASVAGVFKFRMGIEGVKRVAEVSSPTHQLKTEEVMDCVNVCVAGEGPVRGDVTILIGYKDPHEPMAMVEAAIEGSKTKEMKSKAVMLTFFPKFSGIEEAACEFIFVVDRSGSMGGSYIKSASETLVLFLKSIPQGCFFNIISFGSQYESFFQFSKPYSQETMEKATQFAQKMKADMGGTELLAPLKFIFRQPSKSSGLPRQVFILTDGSVGNTSSVISEVRKNCHSARCFTFGIGSGASSALVRGIARAGNGSAEFIANNERMQSKVIHSLKKALQPSANNLAVKFELPGSCEVKVVPDNIPSIYDGEKTVIYGLLMDKSDDKGRDGLMSKAILSGDILGKEFKFEIPFQLPVKQTEEDVSVVHQLAAKVMIQEWQDDGEPHEKRHKKEITELSCDASVVSRYTAYIAVDEAQNKPVSGTLEDSDSDDEWEENEDEDASYLAESVPQQKEAYLQETSVATTIPTSQVSPALLSSSAASSAPPPSKQSDPSFIVSLQQFDGSWLLNDKLAGVVSKSVEELKSCSPVSCDVTMMANIWATLVAIELLKKKYPSMLDELELVIMKAEQWVGKQVLPSGVNLVVLKDSVSKIVTV